MNKEQEATDIFRSLRAFAKKHNAEFLCIVRYPIEGISRSRMKFLSDEAEDSHGLIKHFFGLS